MKRTFPLFVCAAFAALLVAECAFAETVVVSALQGQPAKRDRRDYTSTVPGWSATPSLWAENTVQAETRLRTRPNVNDAWMTWLQFDLSSVWATHDKADLQSATLSLIIEGGTSTRRRFYVYGMSDGLFYEDDDGNPTSSYENWSENTLTWNNAPANNLADSLGAPDMTQVYNGAALEYWQAIGTGNYWWTTGMTDTVNGIPTMTNFVGTDTDNKVTFILAQQDTVYLKGVGDALGSPYLTLTFIPEPATLAILGLGGLLLRRRIA